MPHIAYRKVSGRAVDLRFVPPDYQPLPDESMTQIADDELPPLASLSDPTPLAGIQADAVFVIDAAAEAARLRYITPGAGQAATYLIKEAQARAYVAAGYPVSIDSYPMVRAEVRARFGVNPTTEERHAAVDGIIGQAEAWYALASAIEEVRRAGKVACDVAADGAAVIAARDAAVSALNAI